VRIVGTARISESRRTGQSAEAPGDLREFLRLDLSRLDDQIDGDVLDIWIAAEVSDPVDDPLLSPVALPELSDGPHLSYAIQWLIFSCGRGDRLGSRRSMEHQPSTRPSIIAIRLNCSTTSGLR